MAGISIKMRHALALSLFLVSLTTGCSPEDTIAGFETSPAQLQVDTAYPGIRGATISVAAGGDFQDALDAAQPGDVIELEAGATFTGPFVLPRKPPVSDPDSGWILIRSAAPPGTLPPPGRRIDPSYAPYMATLEGSTEPILGAAPGAHHFRFEGIRVRPARTGASLVAKWGYWARSKAAGVEPANPASSEVTFFYNLIILGTDADRIADLPHHIIFDRCYIHGDPLIGARRGIALNSRHTAVINSYLADFKEVGVDSQGILGWNGPGPFKIVNNYVEAAGENIMFGSAVPRIDGLVPADIEIRGNHFSKPLSWKVDDATFNGTPWSVKNLFELKNAERVNIEGNLLEYNWPHAQNGFAVLFTVRNQDGDVPWATVSDVTFRNNLIRNVANGINILGLDDNGHPSRKSTGLVIENNLFLSVGGEWGGGTLFQMLQSTEQVSISHNTAAQSASILVTDGKGVHQSFQFVGNLMPHNDYGIIGTDVGPGFDTLNRDFPDAVVAGNVLIGGDANRYPADNEFPEDLDVLDTLTITDELDGNPAAGVDLRALCAALDAANPSPTEDLAFCQFGD